MRVYLIAIIEANAIICLMHTCLLSHSISNAGLRHLSSLTSLEVLNLDSRDIGDDGLKYLRHLPLKSLDLFSGRVTDLG